MAAGTARVWPFGLAAAVVLAAAAPAHSADRAGPVPGTSSAAPIGSARVVLLNTDMDTGRLLPGARFELWRETNDRAGLQSEGPAADEKHDGACVTDAKGSCTVELPVGETYYWLATAPPAGYEPTVEPVTGFDLREGDVQSGLVLDVPNRQENATYSGRVRVAATDEKTGRPLHGTVFELWRETDQVAGLQVRGIDADRRVRPGCATDAGGVCDFDRLADGWYYVVETAVPEGYVMLKAPVTGPLQLDAENRRFVVTVRTERDDHGRVPAADDEQDESAEEAEEEAGRRAGAPFPEATVK
ncbi:MSCRAMM family protein [Streptomyces sp. NPDC054945]